MTVITVSTVGYSELYPLSVAGRIFTGVLICVGVGIAAVAFSVITRAVFRHQLSTFMEKRGMRKEIDSTSGHIIVCGFGRMGGTIAAALRRAGKRVVVVEHDQQVAEDAEREGMLVIFGDASEEDVLTDAGIERAESLVATLGSDADNLFLTLTARDMNNDLNIIARAEDENNCRKFTKAGASRVVSPLTAGSNRIIKLITRPDIIDFVELVAADDDIQFEVSRIDVADDSPFAGKTLAGGKVRQNIGGMVLTIKRADGSTVFDPSPDMVVNPGDALFVVGAAHRHTE
jgi:voltage-gated potassium channel